MLTALDLMTQWPEHKAIETYLYYDMPLLYSTLFSDCHDCPHWVLLSCIDLDLGDTTPSQYTETWLGVRMSTTRKQAMVENRLCLREAITQAEDHQVFRISLVNGDPAQVAVLSPSELDPEDLPDPGVTLSD